MERAGSGRSLPERALPRLSREQIESLSAAIRSHEFLHRMLRQIEISQRTVFHANERADWSVTRASAEQMLIAELALRYHGDIDKVYFKLRDLEKQGKDWTAGINELASAIHSYYTTPLGMVLRRDLFADDVAFLAPGDAAQWIQQTEETGDADTDKTSTAADGGAAKTKPPRRKNEAAQRASKPRKAAGGAGAKRTTAAPEKKNRPSGARRPKR